ncbi:MAG: undecaprenyldiphospho-muramoylpentapeptide beta-N-acetylglucosaminyltransferase [Granulosicoccus sp.]
MNAPVVIAAGGTGGHVVPALAVAEVLGTKNVPVVWLGTERGLEARLVPAAGIDIRWIDIAGLRGKGLLATIAGPFKLLRACQQSMAHLSALQPRAVLGMGGFVAGPVGIAALLMRKPLVLHEQNAVAGMTNRWLARFATRVFSAWPNVFRARDNAVTVGNPVRRDMQTTTGNSEQGLPVTADRALRVLVVGGSLGARVLNEILPEAAASLDIPLDIQHQSGVNEFEAVQQRYADMTALRPVVKVTVSAFIDDISQAYQYADLVISRAGAMTVTELGARGVASILVPFPYAVDDHQTRNAEHLSNAGAALLVPQASLTPASLAAQLQHFHEHRDELVVMASCALQSFQANAAERVAEALLEVSD